MEINEEKVEVEMTFMKDGDWRTNYWD
jgi:hypothetical protein